MVGLLISLVLGEVVDANGCRDALTYGSGQGTREMSAVCNGRHGVRVLCGGSPYEFGMKHWHRTVVVCSGTWRYVAHVLGC